MVASHWRLSNAASTSRPSVRRGYVPAGGPRLRSQLSSDLQAWWVCFGKLMGHEAGRRGKLLEHHEHSKNKRTGARVRVSRIALQGSQQRAPPTPDSAGVRRGSRFSGPLAKRQISVRLSVGFRAGGREKKVGHGFTLRYQRSARASQPGPSARRTRGKDKQGHMLTCAPAGSAGVGFFTEDDASGAGGNWNCGRIIAWTG